MVLRGVRDERPPRRSREAGWTESEVQGQACSPEYPDSLEMGLARRWNRDLRSGKWEMSAYGVNGWSRLSRPVVWLQSRLDI